MPDPSISKDATGRGRDTALASECRVFSRYLVGREPGRYVVERYVAAHRSRRELIPPTDGFDAFLVALARRGPVPAWLVDCFARLWAPGSLLRRKLVLLVAVLECAPRTSGAFGRGEPQQAVPVACRLGLRAAAFAGGALISTLLLLPVRFAHRLSWTRTAGPDRAHPREAARGAGHDGAERGREMHD